MPNNNKGVDKGVDKYLQTIINIGVIVLFVIIVYLIYKYFIENDYRRLALESFIDNEIITTQPATNDNKTVYEMALDKMYSNNQRMMCNMLPTINRSLCKIKDVPFVPNHFPVHLIKLPDSSILAVFNDGRLYSKTSLTATLWQGPLEKSLPKSTIPLRMIALGTDLETLLGVGFDNILYIKRPDTKGKLDLKADWQQVPNNSNIIYILFDNETNYMISIDIRGKVLIKSTADLTTYSKELPTLLDRPILKLFYDLNGYMLALDTEFDLYQFNEKNWKQSPLNISRGHNSSKIQDIIYHNDGKLYGLIFNSDNNSLEMMKQLEIFYLSDFIPLEMKLSKDSNSNFVMTDLDIIKAKNGSINDYTSKSLEDDDKDDDPNYANQKQILDNTAKLRQFCAERSSKFNNQDNYELLSKVDDNKDKIGQLKNIINTLLKYEPEKDKILQKYPELQDLQDL
jgi:hypothetical protein